MTSTPKVSHHMCEFSCEYTHTHTHTHTHTQKDEAVERERDANGLSVKLIMEIAFTLSPTVSSLLQSLLLISGSASVNLLLDSSFPPFDVSLPL